MNQIDPKSLKIINSLPPAAKKGDKVSLDTEWFNQIKGKLHRAHGQFAFLGCSFDGQTVYYITDETQIQEFMDRLNAGVWVFHHAKYDITQLRRFANIPQRKLLWDTLLIEQIMWSGYYQDFGLNDLARRYLDVYMPKEVRSEFSENDTASMTQDQLEYAAVDVAATWRIYQAQRTIIDETDLEIWKNIELPFLWTLLSMGGIKLDQEKWLALAKKNGDAAEIIRQKYPSINLNSPKQVKDYFKSQYGISAKSTDVEFLEAHPDNEFAQDMLNYRNYAKRASTYGVKFIEDYVEADGKIYADMYQIGAETSRTSCRAPNLQNQPHEDDYRDCFIAEEKKCLIIGDYSSQEPRFAAYFSDDQGLIDALHGTEKLYIRIAREALEMNIKKPSKEYDDTKSTILGLFYGMSAYGLAKRIGVSTETAQDMINKILRTYPGVKDYMDRQRQAEDYVTTVYGRKIWLNKYSYQWERNALNAPIQGSAAEAMKLAASRFNEWIRDAYIEDGSIFDWKILLLVHDEIVISVPEEDCGYAKTILKECMISVANEMHDGIRADAELFSGNSWSAKH